MASMLTNALKGAVLFGLLGPIVGVVTFVVLSSITKSTCCSLLEWLPSLVLGAYVFGGLPAIACGLFAGILRHRLNGITGYFLIGAAGAVLSLGYYLLLSIGSWIEADWALRSYIAPGFVAGTVCGRMFLKPPNNSFKPKPLRGSA